MSAPTVESTNGIKISPSDTGKYLIKYDPQTAQLVNHGIITRICPVEVSDGRDNWSQSYAEISLDTRKSTYLHAGERAFIISVPQAPRPDLERLEAEIEGYRVGLIGAALEISTNKMISASKGLPLDTKEAEKDEKRLDDLAKDLTKALTRYKEAK